VEWSQNKAQLRTHRKVRKIIMIQDNDARRKGGETGTRIGEARVLRATHV